MNWTDYLSDIDLGLTLLQAILSKYQKNKAPVEVTAAIQAAIDAVLAHKDDVITKAALESQRG